MKPIADVLQKVLPEPAPPYRNYREEEEQEEEEEVGTQTEPVAIPSTSAEYETPKPRFNF